MSLLKLSWSSRAFAAGIALAAAGTLGLREARASVGGYQFVVNAANPATHVAREDVVRCYLGERRRWQNGDPVVPLDLSATSPLRAMFSREVLGRSVDAVRIHWMRLIASGRARPPVTAAEEDVLETIAKDKRAIGYVSSEAVLPTDVKAVPLSD